MSSAQGIVAFLVTARPETYAPVDIGPAAASMR